MLMRAPDPVLVSPQLTRSVLVVGAVQGPVDQEAAVDVTLLDFLKFSKKASPLQGSLFFYICAGVKNLTPGFTTLILSA
jgi:phage FluMu protein gp41